MSHLMSYNDDIIQMFYQRFSSSSMLKKHSCFMQISCLELILA